MNFLRGVIRTLANRSDHVLPCTDSEPREPASSFILLVTSTVSRLPIFTCIRPWSENPGVAPVAIVRVRNPSFVRHRLNSYERGQVMTLLDEMGIPVGTNLE